MRWNRYPRVLFVRPDHLGDVLLTLPAVAALRRALPAAPLAYAAPGAAAALAARCPALDETLAVPFPAVARRERDAAAWRRALGAAAPSLAGRFDAALVVRPDDPWSGALTARASVPVRIGFDMPRTRPYLTDVLPVPRDQHVALDAFDLVDALLRRLGLAAPVSRVLTPAIVPTDDDEEEATRVLSESGADGAPVVLHPGSGWPLKNWPIRRWRRLAGALARLLRTEAVVAGSSGERDVTLAVADGNRALDLGGRLSVGGLAAVHGRARLVVTTDSGALHLAAAMGAPVVGLFGPGDPVRFAPLGSSARVRIVRVGLPCSPCGTLEDPPCGAAVDPACVAGIAVDDVLRAAVDLLDDGGGRASVSGRYARDRAPS